MPEHDGRGMMIVANSPAAAAKRVTRNWSRKWWGLTWVIPCSDVRRKIGKKRVIFEAATRWGQ